jgi:acyl-coenzyme A thioesterase PaaI-like protein
MRWGLNCYPAYRGTGARITYIAGDWREVRVRLPLSWRTRNYVGTIFGGSIYAAVDPFPMLMLIKVLGPDYIVWDKAASIEFQRPGRSVLYATIELDEEETESIKSELTRQPSTDRVYQLDLQDEDGTICASVQKTIYIRRRESNHSSADRA